MKINQPNSAVIANIDTCQHPPQLPVRREVQSLQLLGDSRELLIRHGRDCYTLRHTSKGKLILTK